MNDIDLAARIRRLEDRAEIRELVAHYGFAVDDRDLGTLAGLFTPDASFRSQDGVINAVGIDAVMQTYHGRFAVLGLSNHFTHDQVVAFDDDPDLAIGLVNSHAELCRNGQAMITALRYQDTYRRYEGRWRFADRLIHFLYYVPVQEYAEALGSAYRMRAYGDQRPADYPEALPSWQDYLARYGERR